MKYLLLLLSCTACAVPLWWSSQHRQEPAIASGPPSPALLDAMSSHGIEVSTAAGPAADAPDAATPAAAMPELQPAVYRPR
jgi:hypothetical protein